MTQKEITLIVVVLVLNISAIVCFYREKESPGLILKALADGIFLIFVCTR